MRKIITTLSISLVCAMMFCPISEGQNRGRNNQNGGNSRPSVTRNESRQSQNSNRGNSGQSNFNRPGNNNSSMKGNNRPSNNIGQGNINRGNNNSNIGQGNVNRGGSMNGNIGQGAVNRPGNNRPNNGGWNTQVPGMNRNAGPRPGGGGRDFNHGAPMRPYMPANRIWHRPTPPAHFRPYRGCPSFSTILGITLGSAINYSLDRLLGAGYNVLGYVADAIYLSNVPMFNYTWPNATMYYNDGCLYGSEFTYSTPGFDRSRYTMIYNELVRQYGAPVSVQNNGNYDMSATWWGNGNRYVTLSYYTDYAYNGAVRYYTTLSFGN